MIKSHMHYHYANIPPRAFIALSIPSYLLSLRDYEIRDYEIRDYEIRDKR